jgi:hypothetical protein
MFVLRLKFLRITAQQTQLDLRLSCDSVHGSYCSHIEQVGLTTGPQVKYAHALKMAKNSKVVLDE